MCDGGNCGVPSFRIDTPLVFTIVEDEEGEWDYGEYNDPIYFHGKVFEEIREKLVKYVKDNYGNTKFWIRLETDPKNWSI